MDEFKDLNTFVKTIESANAHQAGIVKIIPPPEFEKCKRGLFERLENNAIHTVRDWRRWYISAIE